MYISRRERKERSGSATHSKRGIECLKQGRIAEGLGQALHRTLFFKRSRADSLVSVPGDEDDRNLLPAKPQFPLKVGPRHPRHNHIEDPMIPHVLVLEPGLVIYKIYNGYWFLGRPTLEDLRQDLRAVTRKCRPDWDITTPELRAAWQQGRKELFYP